MSAASLRCGRSVFFDAGNEALPKVVELLEVVRPDAHLEMSDDELHDEVVRLTREREVRVQEKASTSWASVSRRGLRASATVAGVTSKSKEARFTVTPTLASKSKWARIAQVSARPGVGSCSTPTLVLRMLAGDPAVRFPAGTYWLRRFVGVLVGPAP